MVRFKNRWLLAELMPFPLEAQSRAFNEKQIWSAIKQSVLDNFGVKGWGEVASSLTVKYYSPTTNAVIIRVARDAVRTAWAALTLLQSVEGQLVLPHVVHVSGTIKKAQLAAIAYNRETVAKYRTKAHTSAAYHDSYTSFLTQSEAEIGALQD